MAIGIPVQQSGDPYVDASLIGSKWDSPVLTYNFPAQAGYYPPSYGNSLVVVNATFRPAGQSVRDAIAWAVEKQLMQVTLLSYTVVAPDAAADTSIAGIDLASAAIGGYPGGSQSAGDIWYDTTLATGFSFVERGSYNWRNIIHELGHSLGLKHGSDIGGPANAAMPADRDSLEFSLMTNRWFVGGPADTSPTRVGPSSWPQTLMMNDIAALQWLYGANYSANGSNTTYTWSPTTGELFVDGLGQGKPSTNCVFMTVWDGNGSDTYDCSNYAVDVQLDLRPGGWSVLDPAQRATLDVANNVMARGNVFNALLHDNDTRSLIENAVGGAGDDLIIGNPADNHLTGGAGTDTVVFSGPRDAYVIAGTSQERIVAGPEGTDRLSGIERLVFADHKVALDLGIGERACEVVCLIAAAFGPAFLQPEVIGTGLRIFDRGMGLIDAARIALADPTFHRLAGSTTNDAFVDLVYRNVVGAAPTPAEHAHYVSMLRGAGGRLTQDELLAIAANTEANATRIGLTGLQQSGVEFS